jgi:hypothetical protein
MSHVHFRESELNPQGRKKKHEKRQGARRAERFAVAIADEVEERRNKREKQTIARNEKLAFLRETLEAAIKQFDDVKDGYARIEEEYVTLDDAWAKFKIEMYAIASAA